MLCRLFHWLTASRRARLAEAARQERIEAYQLAALKGRLAAAGEWCRDEGPVQDWSGLRMAERPAIAIRSKRNK